MALNDNAPLTAGHGYVLIGDFTGGSTAAEPTLAQLLTFASAGTLPTNWTQLGHTSQDNLLTPSQDGGDVTTSGSWQKTVLKSTQAPVVEKIAIPSIQLDNDTLRYYYGGGTYATANRFVGPTNPAPIERRVCFVLVQSDTEVAGLYWPKASIIRDDSWSVATDKPTEFPLGFTRLDQSGQPPFVWIGANVGTGS